MALASTPSGNSIVRSNAIVAFDHTEVSVLLLLLGNLLTVDGEEIVSEVDL